MAIETRVGQDSRLNINVREADVQTTGTMFWWFAKRFKNDDKRFHLKKNPTQTVAYEGKKRTRNGPKVNNEMCVLQN